MGISRFINQNRGHKLNIRKKNLKLIVYQLISQQQSFFLSALKNIPLIIK